MTLYRVKLKLFDLTRYRIFLQIKVLECDAISLGKFRTYFQNSERSLSGEIGTFIPILIWKMLFHWYHLRNSIYIFFDIFAGGINVSAMWGKFYAKPHAACFFWCNLLVFFLEVCQPKHGWVELDKQFLCSGNLGCSFRVTVDSIVVRRISSGCLKRDQKYNKAHKHLTSP